MQHSGSKDNDCMICFVKHISCIVSIAQEHIQLSKLSVPSLIVSYCYKLIEISVYVY